MTVFNFKNIFRGDRVIWMVFLLLCLISIVEVYSASATLTYRTTYWKPISSHILFLFGGTFLVLLVHICKPRYFSLIGIALIITWGLLIYALFWGIKENEAARWIRIFGIKFQPSEFAKLCLIVFSAFTLSKKKSKEDDKRIFLTILIATGVTCALIGIDNLSTAVLLFGIVFVMMFIGQISWKRLLMLLVGLTVFVGLAIVIIKNVPEETLLGNDLTERAVTWKHRIENHSTDISVNDSTFKITDKNFQEAHANIAISNANFIGRGPGKSIERDFLPQAYSDFIYAIIIEEIGLIGGLVVLLLYIIFFIRAGVIANRSERLFSKYMVMGSALILVTQALANMAVAVGLIPVTGQTLPLVSRGGTSIIITCIYFGIILSVSCYDNPKGVKREEEIEKEFEEAQENAVMVSETKQSN